MEYLKRLTDVSLKRLYKFVLQRAIGRFLAADLLLDQLELVDEQGSGAGLVVVSDLDLDCDALNEELAASLFPNGESSVTVCRAHIDSLEARVSYSSILFDGCKLRGRGITVEITPYLAPSSSSSIRKRSNSKTKASRPISKSSTSSSNGNNGANYSSSEGQEGLAFIAHWVETLIARLQIEVDGLLLIMHSGSSPSPSLELSISKAVFHNAHPHLLDGSSIAASERAMRPHEGQNPALNHRKLLMLSGLSVGFPGADPEASQPYLNSDELVVQLKLAPDGLLEDIDMVAPYVRLCLADIAAVTSLLGLYEVYFGGHGETPGGAHSRLRRLFECNSVGDAAMATILWLEQQNNTSGGDIDFSKVIELIKQYKMAHNAIDRWHIYYVSYVYMFHIYNYPVSLRP